MRYNSSPERMPVIIDDLDSEDGEETWLGKGKIEFDIKDYEEDKLRLEEFLLYRKKFEQS